MIMEKSSPKTIGWTLSTLREDKFIRTELIKRLEKLLYSRWPIVMSLLENNIIKFTYTYYNINKWILVSYSSPDYLLITN